jgi:pre-mRNA-splicing factor RBM22/SLT11
LRMIKQPSSKECKVSGRVFTSFRWRPGAGARYKETVICPEVARAKGVCQCCLMDMEFNLPVGVRDALLSGAKEDAAALPQSGVNQTYYYDQVAKASREEVEAGYGKMANDKLLKMARSSPYYDRNLPKLCSFWLKGQCTRVVEGTCPYRPCCGSFRFPELASNHPVLMQKLISALDREGAVKVMKDKSEEMEDIKEKMKESQRGSRDQNIRNRYHGNDELTNKYLGKAEQMDLEPPEDKTITTLYVSLMGLPITEKELIDQFYAYGEIKSIQVIPLSNCAFVTYTTREAAETAVEKLHGSLTVRGARLKMMWGRPQSKRPGQGEGLGGIPAPPTAPTQEQGGGAGAPAGFYAYPVAGPPGMPAGPPPPPPGRPPTVGNGAQVGYGGGGTGRIMYPSMDPSNMGTVRSPNYLTKSNSLNFFD